MDDRFNTDLLLTPGSRTIVDISLDEIAAGPERRRLDLARVGGLILFVGSDPQWIGRRFCINRIWLD